MDDILDEWNYALLKHKMCSVVSSPENNKKVCCSFIPSSRLCFKKFAVRRHTAKKIQNVNARVDKILKEKDDFDFVMSLSTSDPVPKICRVQSTSSIELEHVYGRDEDENNIVRKLIGMVNDDSQILSVVGMGGIGKTTLAQLVYNDTRVKDCFELRIWICVSDPFDVGGIARDIVSSVGKETIPQGNNQLEVILQKLRDSISGKKFFLVLDDVWTEDYTQWEPLKIKLKDGALGSKILVTTRNGRVAKMMGTLDDDIYRPQQLTDEECWTMLRRMALFGASEEECIVYGDIGRKIARKCKGLPLAANVLGNFLQFKSSLEEWEYVLESDIWKLEKAEVGIFPHLLLSYNELTPTLKRCFSYCAIYRKDSRIRVTTLIQEWMALGYLGYDIGNAGVELKGREYFNNLAMRSLFQDFEKGGEQIEWCKMHDVVHDFARFLRKSNDTVGGSEMTKRSCHVCDPLSVSHAQEYRSLFWRKESPAYLCDCLVSLRVLRFRSKLNVSPLGIEKLIHLRWLELSGTMLSKEDLKAICKIYFLQTLLLACCSLKEIPAEIGNLVHLRHLDLSLNADIKELPESMCSLLELRILNIESCSVLYGLPEEIHRLGNLQHLLTEHSNASRRFPQGLAQLSGLHTLSEFHAGNGCNKLALLKALNRLCGSLKLEIHFSSSSDLEELVEGAREAELRNKIHIHTLNVQFKDEMDGEESSSSSSSLQMDLMEALAPNQTLRKLEIWGYTGSRLQSLISSPLTLLKDINLLDCSELSSLPPMGKLPLLELLYMGQLKQLKLVGREFLGIGSNDFVAFPKLKGLKISVCPKWEEWEDITAEEEESAAVSIMPSLTRLYIYSCGAMKTLPHRLLRKASSLQILSIGDSSELERSYGDKDGSPWRSISCNNPQLQLSNSMFT